MLDRNRQRQMLEILAASYPMPSADVVREEHKVSDCANLWYLQEHELVRSGLSITLGHAFIFEGASITAKGMDFLTDDGGLSAILGTVTVKLHSDTIKDLLNTKLAQSTLPPDEKSWVRKQIDTMTGESLKTLTKALVEQGLSQVPNLYAWVQTILQPAP